MSLFSIKKIKWVHNEYDASIIIASLFNNLGINFVDGDILPTPTVLFAVRKHKYDGAIIITASHNPREYNGLKFVTDKALFISEKEVEIIKGNYKKIESENIALKIQGQRETTISQSNLAQEHANQIIKNIRSL